MDTALVDRPAFESPAFDRTTEDVGNVVEFGHVNVFVPDQRLATLFYVSGLGLTRDPFLMTGTDNMWVNAGTTQFHLPAGAAQVLGGVVGLVLPDLDGLRRRLARVQNDLAGTAFAVADQGDSVLVTCPWGNRIRCHAAPLGRLRLGIATVEMGAPPGTAASIARFYREVLRSPAAAGGGIARVPMGADFTLVFTETDAPLPPWDGSHIQMSLADFSGPHGWLAARGLVTEESDRHQWRFTQVVDPDTLAPLVTLEHEVRSMRHPLFARPLVNRNPNQSNRSYLPGHEVEPWA